MDINLRKKEYNFGGEEVWRGRKRERGGEGILSCGFRPFKHKTGTPQGLDSFPILINPDARTQKHNSHTNTNIFAWQYFPCALGLDSEYPWVDNSLVNCSDSLMNTRKCISVSLSGGLFLS